MLDSETKARIDSARDILVGKVPDPKSQVEQITIALIYKFMDDMDGQSEDIGGKATFFSGEFKKYRWANLIDRRMGGHERLLLYAEGIEKMNENKKIPQLFRDIFRGVFLPYRDPETLNLFLKEIDGFAYDHSERLGDAYEYLLSVLGTQGDAGQFRTPRHIIDFIAAVVDPQKHETILDPACGTAGFLISAFKHIMKMNDVLTPDERAGLMTNFCGYDIAPDMVRLSRVNLYLHGFPNPTIHEYDTLTSEQRWDERFDVIMANPPFMTPKGGIRPHNRFSINAKRSEVLFVDYIAEHLNPGGRAGVIVPEGIIFQSQNAYKQLRKMLVNNYLWAVVSLPAGVFNPYSGVKTSILFLDRGLAKRTDDLLFVKIENDGFDLGAQRRPNGKGDLPEALSILNSHKHGQATGENAMALKVSRQRLLENSDCNLSGERYRPTIVRGKAKWPMVRIKNVASVNKETCDPHDIYGVRTFCYVDISAVENGTGLISFSQRVKGIDAPSRAKRVIRASDILLSTVRPNLQAFGYLDKVPPDVVASTGFAVLTPDPEKAMGRFIYYLLFSGPVMKQMLMKMGKGSYPSITQTDVEEIEIPVPPMAEQERIVAELEYYRKVIEGARQVLANYKPTIRIDPEWPIKEFGTIVRNLDWKRVPIEKGQRKAGPYPYYGASGIVDYVDDFIFDGNYLLVSEDGANLVARSTPIAFGVAGKVWVNNHAHVLEFDDPPTQKFIEYHINSIDIEDFITGAAQPKLSQANMNRIPIPLPPLSIQRQIVAEIEAEQALVAANRELITRMEKKIQARLMEVWGEEGTRG